MSTTSFLSAPSSLPALLRHPLSSLSSRPSENDIVNSWILEFVLRQPIPNGLALKIFASLPLSSSLHPHLRKTVLLRRLASDIHSCSLSERTLHSLELIEEHDRSHGAAPSNSLKAAYCAAAVECTAAAHRRGSKDFADAVNRIWKSRIVDIERSEAAFGLVSEELIEWAKRMERCALSGGGGEELFDRDIEQGVSLVKDYLNEAMEEMGLSFLEIAAAELKDNGMDSGGSASKVGKVKDDDQCARELVINGKSLEAVGIGEKCEGFGDVRMRGSVDDGVLEPSGVLEDVLRKELEDDGIREGSGDRGDASTEDADGCYGATGFQLDPVVEVEDEGRYANLGGHGISDPCGGLIHKLDPTEVSKVKEALKKSLLDLEAMVDDPLSEAEIAAAAVLMSISSVNLYLNEPAKHSSEGNALLQVSANEPAAEGPTGIDTNTGALAKEKCNLVPLPDIVNKNPSDSKHLEENVTVEEFKDAEQSKRKDTFVHHTLFERNQMGHTSELSEDSQQSPNPKTKRISLPRLDDRKLVKRRAVKRWTSLEENTLREAVAKHGIGNWKLILIFNAEVFEGRTEVDLKDKWRNMSRYLLQV